MKKEEFRNESGLEFKDISSEAFREYNFPNGRELYIENPLFLNVSQSGGHRIWNQKGISYYIQPKEGWWIEWVAKENEPHFVK